jgi:hypothetical protein
MRAGLAELIDLMVAKGVRRIKDGDLEVELDPAAQLINAPKVEQEQVATAEDKKVAGLCPFRGCKDKGGHMRTPYCRAHFSVALTGRAS